MAAIDSLREEINKVHIATGRLSSRRIASKADKVGAPVAHATVAKVLRMDDLPKWETLQRVIQGMGHDPARFQPLWDEAYREGQHVPEGLVVEGEAAEWVNVRNYLNANRGRLAAFASELYRPEQRLGDTGLLSPQSAWFPNEPIDLDSVELDYDAQAIPPVLDGRGEGTTSVRPLRTVAERYITYMGAVGELARPRLFFNAFGWRLTDVRFGRDPKLRFASTTYFETNNICEAVAHETASVHRQMKPNSEEAKRLVDFPIRRALVGDPFDLMQRSVLPAISTLVILNTPGRPRFWLQRRDAAAVATAGGMLQVIPSGAFQPANPHLGHDPHDFSLWRNVMREFAEELLGRLELSGDDRVAYDQPPLKTLDDMRRGGLVKVFLLGVALDALTLFGEVLTVAVVEPEAFRVLTEEVVLRSEEGELMDDVEGGEGASGAKALDGFSFAEPSIRRLIETNSIAPAGAGCLHLAWANREKLLNSTRRA